MSEGFFSRLIKKVELVEKRKIAKIVDFSENAQSLPADEPENLSDEIVFDSSAMADPDEVQALMAKMKGDYEEELIIYEKLLSSSDPEVRARSQYGLAILYQNGHGVEVDLKRAFGLHLQAAATGYSLAQTSLANFYMHGLIGSSDIEQALHWYLRAAKKGEPDAMFAIANLYWNAKKYDEAAEWYKLAADQGDCKACYNFAILHLTGKVWPNNLDLAREYLNFGAELDDVNCAMALGIMYSKGDGVEVNHYEAIKYYGIAAKLGDAEGMYEFGSLCRGDSVKKNLSLAVNLITDSAEHGYAKAQSTIGKMYLDGTEVIQDYEMAVHWLTKAAAQNEETALYSLGYMAEYGNCVPVDFIEAHKWYNLACAQGLTDAQERRDELARRMSPTDIAAAQNRAREWAQENAV